jgi:flagellar protein FliO/FliZ
MELWDSLSRMVSALAVVVALMLICAYALRRLQGTRLFARGTAPLVNVLANGYVGQRKSIMVVNVAGEILIVGTTADDLVPLGRITDRERIAQLTSTAVSREASGASSKERAPIGS